MFEGVFDGGGDVVVAVSADLLERVGVSGESAVVGAAFAVGERTERVRLRAQAVADLVVVRLVGGGGEAFAGFLEFFESHGRAYAFGRENACPPVRDCAYPRRAARRLRSFGPTCLV